MRTMHSILNDFTLHHANRIGQADAEVSKVRGIYIYNFRKGFAYERVENASTTKTTRTIT